MRLLIAHQSLQSPQNMLRYSEIVDTIREPLIVLDKDLRAIAASRSFYVKFATNPEDTRGKQFYELGNGQWNISGASLAVGKNHTGPLGDGRL
jgi:hypothetical protein